MEPSTPSPPPTEIFTELQHIMVQKRVMPDLSAADEVYIISPETDEPSKFEEVSGSRP